MERGSTEIPVLVVEEVDNVQKMQKGNQNERISHNAKVPTIKLGYTEKLLQGTIINTGTIEIMFTTVVEVGVKIEE